MTSGLRPGRSGCQGKGVRIILASGEEVGKLLSQALGCHSMQTGNCDCCSVSKTCKRSRYSLRANSQEGSVTAHLAPCDNNVFVDQPSMGKEPIIGIVIDSNFDLAPDTCCRQPALTRKSLHEAIAAKRHARGNSGNHKCYPLQSDGDLRCFSPAGLPRC